MKFTDQAPKIDTPTYIKPGVDKQAFGNLISGALKTGEKVYTDYQIGSLRDDINKEVKAYEDARIAQQESGPALAAAGGAAMAIDELWQSDSMMGETNIDQVNALEKEYKTNLEKFQAAKNQGRISEEELVARINKTTREFVNRNPWMEQELYSAAQQHLKNTGVADILKYRQDLAQETQKAERDDYKAIRNQLLQAGVPGGWRPGMPMDEMLRNLTQHQKVEYTTQMWKNFDIVSKGLDKEQIKSMLPTLYKDGIYSITNSKNREWAAQLSQLQQPGQIVSAIEIMRQDAANEVMLMRSRLAEAGVLHTDEAKEAVKNFEDGLMNSLKGLESVADGKKAAEILKSRADVIETGQRINVLNTVNKPAWDMMTEMLSAMPESLKQRFVQNFGIDKMVKTGAQLMDKTFATTPEVQSFIKSGTAAELFGGIMQAGNNNPNNPSFVQASKMLVESLNKAYTAGELTPTEQHVSINATLAHIAQNGKMFSVHTDPGLTSGLKPQIDFHMSKYGPGMFQAAQGHMKKNPGVQITYDVTPTGGLVVYSNDPDIAADLNRHFVSQVNNALDAWANVNGVSREKVAPEFYKQYFGDILADDPDIGGKGKNPDKIETDVERTPSRTGNMRSVDDVLKAYNRGAINDAQYKALIDFFQSE